MLRGDLRKWRIRDSIRNMSQISKSRPHYVHKLCLYVFIHEHNVTKAAALLVLDNGRTPCPSSMLVILMLVPVWCLQPSQRGYDALPSVSSVPTVFLFPLAGKL
jgi:hypothetical protein